MRNDRRRRSARFVHSAPSCSAKLARRRFLAAGAASVGWALLASSLTGGEQAPQVAPPPGPDVPRVDLHVHLDNSTIQKALEIARQRNVTLGIVEHAGTRENQYPVVLTSDEELGRYLGMLEGKGVYCGVQAEWTDWSSVFSTAMLRRLDYVLMDAMTFPGKDGRRVKLWEQDVESRVEMSDRQAFMDRFVDWHVEIIEKQPIDILANVSWLPRALAEQYEAFWTPPRIRRVVEAAVRCGVAIEISTSYRLPKPYFLKIARAAGAKFTFGSNGRYPNMGRLDYGLEMARELRLAKDDFFTPKPPPARV